MKRKVTTRLTEEECAELSRRARACGFRSVYELMRALVGLFMRATEPREAGGGAPSVADEVRDMFAALSDSEAPCYEKPHRRRPRDKINEQ